MFRKLKNFQTEFFASKCSEGHVTISFDSANEVFWQRFKLFNSISKNVKKTSIFFRKMFFIKMFLCNHLKQFWQPRQNFSDEKPNFSRSTSEHEMKNKVFKKIYTVPRDRKSSDLTTPQKLFSKKAKKFQLKVRKCKGSLHFPIKIFFSLNFSYEQLESSSGNPAKSQKLVDKRLKILSSKSESDEETMILSREIFFLYWSHGHVKCSFDSPMKRLREKAKNFSLKVQKV